MEITRLGQESSRYPQSMIAIAILIATSLLESHVVAHGIDPSRYRIGASEFSQHCDALSLAGDALRAAQERHAAHLAEIDCAIALYDVAETWHRGVQGTTVGLYSQRLSMQVRTDQIHLTQRYHDFLRSAEVRYFSDLKLLAGTESDRVERLARAHRRRRMLGYDTRLTWERAKTSTDLISEMRNILDARDLDLQPSTRALLETYERQLDLLLSELDDCYPIYRQDGSREILLLREALERGQSVKAQIDRVTQLFYRPVEINLRIRSLTRNTVQELAGKLPTASAEDLMVAVGPDLYPSLYPTGSTAMSALIRMRWKRAGADQERITAVLRPLLDMYRRAASDIDPLMRQRVLPSHLHDAWAQWVEMAAHGRAAEYVMPYQDDVERLKERANAWVDRLEPLERAAADFVAQVTAEEQE